MHAVIGNKILINILPVVENNCTAVEVKRDTFHGEVVKSSNLQSPGESSSRLLKLLSSVYNNLSYNNSKINNNLWVFILLFFSSLGELYYASVLEEIELECQDFKADSWSMAVDTSYLQTHRKNVIKRQDVIYGDQNMICFSSFLPYMQTFSLMLNFLHVFAYGHT